MEGSVGSALRHARLQKKISVEEAARAIKMRAARIADLENDEYDRFPNLAYARSFLLMYAKFLGVDVSKYRTMEVGSPAGVGDYQYLQNEGGVDSLRFTRQRPAEAPVQNLRWLPVFVMFLAFLILGSLTALFVLKVQRVVGKHEHGDKDALGAQSVLVTPAPKSAPAATPQPAQGTPAATPAGEAGAPVLSGTDNPFPPKALPVEGGTALPLRALPADGSVPPPVGEPEVRRALPVNGTPPPVQASPAPTAHPKSAAHSQTN